MTEAVPTVVSAPDTSATPAAASDATRSARSAPALLPPVDVLEDASGITLYADLPGVPRERLQLQVEGDQLAIEGEAVIAVPEGTEPTHVEVDLPRYRRSFTLSRELDASQISAELSHGVLRVRIPKAPHLQTRRVAVQVG
jgi:HSP20 family protein